LIGITDKIRGRIPQRVVEQNHVSLKWYKIS
jgi:hypothetical protein